MHGAYRFYGQVRSVLKVSEYESHKDDHRGQFIGIDKNPDNIVEVVNLIPSDGNGMQDFVHLYAVADTKKIFGIDGTLLVGKKFYISDYGQKKENIVNSVVATEDKDKEKRDKSAGDATK